MSSSSAAAEAVANGEPNDESNSITSSLRRPRDDDDGVASSHGGGGDPTSSLKRPKPRPTATATATATAASSAPSDSSSSEAVASGPDDTDDDLATVLAKLLGILNDGSTSSSSGKRGGPLAITSDDVRELVEEAMTTTTTTEAEEEAIDDNSTPTPRKGEQAALYDAGLLSLQQVLLPLVALHNERELKALQGRIKRAALDLQQKHQKQQSKKKQKPSQLGTKGDGDELVDSDDDACAAAVRIVRECRDREHDELDSSRSKGDVDSAMYQVAVDIVQHCRAASLNAVGAAVEAAQNSEQARVQAFKQQMAEKREQKRAEKRAQQELQQKLLTIGRPKRLREARKKHEPNVELYREQAFLMSELARMDKELEGWDDAERQLVLEAEAKETADLEAAAEAGNNNSDDKGSVLNYYPDDDNKNKKNGPKEYVKELLDEIDHAQVCVDRILSAAHVVDDMVRKSEVTRAELYRHYTESRQFQDYHVPVRHPKELLKGLSQQSTATSASSVATTTANANTTAATMSQPEGGVSATPTAAPPAPLASTTNLPPSATATAAPTS